MAASTATSTAQAAAGNNILAANQGTFAPFLLDTSSSLFQYGGWNKCRNYSLQRIDVNALNSGVALGGTANFDIPKSGDMLGSVQLLTTYTLAQSDAASTYTGCVGGMGYRQVEWIRVTYASKILQTIDDYDMFLRTCLIKNQEQRVAESNMTGLDYGIAANPGDTTIKGDTVLDGGVYYYTPPDTGVAVSAAGVIAGRATTRSYILDIPFFWTSDATTFLLYSPLATNLRIDVKFRTQAQLLFTTPATVATASLTLSSVKLRVSYIQLTDLERAQMERQVNGTKTGITYLTRDYEKQPLSIIPAAGAPTHTSAS